MSTYEFDIQAEKAEKSRRKYRFWKNLVFQENLHEN